MAGNQTFDTPQDALSHYGVKGMRWGVRNDDTAGGGGRRSSKPEEPEAEDLSKVMDAFYATKTEAELKHEGQKKLEAQARSEFPSERRSEKADQARAKAAKFDSVAKDLQETRDAIKGNNLWNKYERKVYNDHIKANEKARDNLIDRAEQLESGKLTDRQKAALIGLGATAAVATLAYYGGKKTQQFKVDRLELNQQETSKQWQSLFGKDFAGTPRSSLAEAPSDGSFYAGLTSKKALNRPEFTIPEGTVFQRLSNHPEDTSEYGKVKGAYATFLHNDKKIYGASGEFGNKKYNINFEADGAARVPTLQTVFAHLKQVQKADYPDQPSMWSDDTVYSMYHQMSGGSWSDSKATRLFDSLRSFGYSAIVDDMDAGYLGDLPVVFFGKAKPATVTERTAVNRGEDKAGILKLSRDYS